MTLWLILTILTAGAALIVAAPFFLRGGSAETGSSVTVYKDQLAEVERDKAQGLIDEAEAASARLEIERRILAAGKGGDAPAGRIEPNWQYRMATGIAAIVVLGSTGLYATLGRPDLPSSQSQASAPDGQQTAQAGGSPDAGSEVTGLVKRLEKRLADNPNDADGWRVLGWSYYNTGRYKDSVAAYRRAVDLQKDNPALKALLGEAMVVEAGNVVTGPALAMFNEVLASSPNDERARFFKGVARAQEGDNRGAIDEWLALYKVAPADAEWTADLRIRIEETAKQAGIDVGARLAEAKPAAPAAPKDVAAAHPGGAPTPGPSAADVEAAKQLAPEDRQAMVAGMVDRLASRLEASPKDPDGWIMLIRSRMTMNDPEKARAALEKAKSIFASEPETQKRIVEAAQAMGVIASTAPAEPKPAASVATAPASPAVQPGTAATPGPTAAEVANAQQLTPEDRQGMAAGMVERLAGRLESSPKDPDGWIMLIRSRMVMKEAEKARADLEKATTVFAGEPETQKRILQAAQELGVSAN